MANVGGAFLSAFLQVLFDRLSPEAEGVINFFKGKKSNIVNLLEELNAVLLSADALLDDAEDKLIRDHKVRRWHEMLQEVIYVADELLDKIDYEALRCKMEGDSGGSRSKFFTKLKISTPFSSFDSAVEPEIKDILHRLKVLIDQRDALGLKQGDQHMKSSRRPPAPLVEESNVYGRNDDKEAIVKLLLSDDTGETNKISVIPIIGMGGIGKTTLAQLIYNDDRVGRHFEVKVWDTISDDFDVFKITKRIYECATPQKYDSDDLFGLQRSLKEALKGKKFLFVLDDVWNEKDSMWDALKSSFESGGHGSRILVTTRNTTIALKMTTGPTHKLEGISEEECWQLFKNRAFIDNAEAEAYPDLQVTGREIIKKCKGLPLAVKSVGGLLRSERNPTIWKNIMQSHMWELYEKEDDILPALWLSYRHLPSHLKRCFAYLSMFPKDYLFRKEKIILLWMGEGFLAPDGKQNFKMEEVGDEYFQELLSRSFLQQSNQDKRAFQMHDLLHDLAIFVSGPFSYSHGNDSRKLTCKTRHLMCDGELGDNFSEARNLHTFLSSGCLFTRRINVLQRVWVYLRVLSLSSVYMENLPDFLGSLKCLRYLDLSYSSIKEIPNSICSLYKLQTLLLSYCCKLTHLPTNIGNLINLRHLDIRGVPLKETPLQICDMKNLQSLTQLVLGAEHSGTISVKEVAKLQHLCGETLRISGLENVIDARDLLGANFKDKNCLRALRLEWSNGDADDSHKEIEILDALQPHTYLENLTIESYRGTRLSDWVGNPSFSNIISMSLENCKNCCFLPSLGHLPFLKELYISGFDGVAKIDDGFCGNISPSFRSLETLSLQNMSEWTEWSFSEATKEGGAFPSLSSLTLWECPKLKVGLPAYLPSLSQLSISHCQQIVGILPGTQLTEVVFPNLENVRIVYCPELELPLQWGSHSNLRDLQIYGCEKMWENRRHWDTLRLSSLKRLNIVGLEDESFPEEGLLPTTLTSLSIWNCENLECLNGKAFQQLTSLEQLKIYNCEKLRCLPEEGLPASLNSLKISCCPLLRKRCKREQGQDWPKIFHIANISII